jgi:hypothetical protein
MNEARRATAIHEAGHAVVSYLLGRRIIYVVLSDNQHGETMTEWSLDNTNFEYYENNDPKEDPESKLIQNALRCDMAIAVAGAIAQGDLCGDSTLIKSELERDLDRANCGAGLIHRGINLHRGLDPRHCRYPLDQCQYCEGYLEQMRSTVRQMLAKPLVRYSIKAVAADKLESLENSVQRNGSEIEKFFEAKGLILGSEIDSLPQVAEAEQSSEETFPSPFG